MKKMSLFYKFDKKGKEKRATPTRYFILTEELNEYRLIWTGKV